MLVLISKGGGDFWRVVLVEVLWKTVTVIPNRNLTMDIGFHDTLHGFQAGQVTGTASLESKLIQQITAMREAILHEIFLYLQKEYDTPDKYRCLNILEG